MNNVYAVLYRICFPGLIGAAARAAKNFGLTGLRLVDPPPQYRLASSAVAHGALDLLDSAGIYSDLATAVADCSLKIGIELPTRTASDPEITPEKAARIAARSPVEGKIAMVFSEPHTAFDCDDFGLLDLLVKVPNLRPRELLTVSQLVLIMGYELFLQSHEPVQKKRKMPAVFEHEARLFAQLQILLQRVGFESGDLKQAMARFHAIFGRAELYDYEVGAWLGICKKFLLNVKTGGTEEKTTNPS